MNKLTLDLASIRVESFDTAPDRVPGGTIFGAADTIYDLGCPTFQTACPDPTCHANTQCCNNSVDDYTCAPTCGSTCGCGTLERTRCRCLSGDYTDCCQTNEPC